MQVSIAQMDSVLIPAAADLDLEMVTLMIVNHQPLQSLAEMQVE